MSLRRVRKKLSRGRVKRGRRDAQDAVLAARGYVPKGPPERVFRGLGSTGNALVDGIILTMNPPSESFFERAHEGLS